MKSFRLSAIALLACLATARADLTMVQKVDGAQGLQQITIKVKGDKARVDVSPEISTIVDGKSGSIINILHEKKMVMRIPGDKVKAMAEMAKSFAKEETPTQGTPKATGKKEKINGYETEEYVTDSPKFHASYWVATNYPNYQTILEQMSVLQKGAFASVTKGLPDYHALPGLPLRTEVKVSGQPDITSTIETVSLDPLPASDFGVPEGYSEMKMPDFLGGAKPSGDR